MWLRPLASSKPAHIFEKSRSVRPGRRTYCRFRVEMPPDVGEWRTRLAPGGAQTLREWHRGVRRGDRARRASAPQFRVIGVVPLRFRRLRSGASGGEDLQETGDRREPREWSGPTSTTAPCWRTERGSGRAAHAPSSLPTPLAPTRPPARTARNSTRDPARIVRVRATATERSVKALDRRQAAAPQRLKAASFTCFFGSGAFAIGHAGTRTRASRGSPIPTAPSPTRPQHRPGSNSRLAFGSNCTSGRDGEPGEVARSPRQSVHLSRARNRMPRHRRTGHQNARILAWQTALNRRAWANGSAKSS